MLNEKEFILEEDLNFFIGFDKYKKIVKVVPYIFNEKRSKIKDLLDNNIIEFTPGFRDWEISLFERKYKVKCHEIWNNKNTIYFYSNGKKKISQKKLNKIVKSYTRVFTRELNYILKREEREQKENKVKENYNNF